MDANWRSPSGSGSSRGSEAARIAVEDPVPDSVQEEVARRVAELRKEQLKERLKKRAKKEAAKLVVPPVAVKRKRTVTPPILKPKIRPRNEEAVVRENLRLLIRQENMRLRSWLVDHCETVTARQRY